MALNKTKQNTMLDFGFNVTFHSTPKTFSVRKRPEKKTDFSQWGAFSFVLVSNLKSKKTVESPPHN